MLEVILIAAAANWPVIFANEYCINRWMHDMPHEEAIADAEKTSLWSDGLIYSEEAKQEIQKSCPQYVQEDAQEE